MAKKHIKDKKLSKVVGGQQSSFDNNKPSSDGGAISSRNRNVTVIE